MIGTWNGCWFSFKELAVDIVEFEFLRHNTLLERGVCHIDQMLLRFDRFVGEQRLLDHGTDVCH